MIEDGSLRLWHAYVQVIRWTGISFSSCRLWSCRCRKVAPTQSPSTGDHIYATGAASVLSPEIDVHSLESFWRMESAVAVQAKGLELRL